MLGDYAHAEQALPPGIPADVAATDGRSGRGNGCSETLERHAHRCDQHPGAPTAPPAILTSLVLSGPGAPLTATKPGIEANPAGPPQQPQHGARDKQSGYHPSIQRPPEHPSRPARTQRQRPQLQTRRRVDGLLVTFAGYRDSNRNHATDLLGPHAVRAHHHRFKRTREHKERAVCEGSVRACRHCEGREWRCPAVSSACGTESAVAERRGAAL